tara:strand:+ start:272 stop:1078 length:807 start_codon:yes stop_codon:yes gene_type:complete
MTDILEPPFGGEVPRSVPLMNTPLASVLAQVRFPEIKKINTDGNFLAEFQEAIRQEYPISVEETGQLVEVMPDEVKRSTRKAWRFVNAEETYRVTVASDYLALETRDYQSKQEFCGRMQTLCLALNATIKPGVMTRIGIRYIDRLYDELFDQRTEYVNPDFISPFLNEHRESVIQSTSQMVARTKEGLIGVRWGYLSVGDSHDAEAMPPLDKESWFVDMDSWVDFDKPVAFDPQAIHDRICGLSDRAYAVFRHIVKDALLIACGGELV